jgi:hypothetical protein
VGAYEKPLEVVDVESRESERDMCTEVIAGVMFAVGDEKYILSVVVGFDVGW